MKNEISEQENTKALNRPLTRRRILSGVAMTLGGITLGIADGWAASEDEISRTCESIHQQTVIKASSERVYRALTDAGQFNEITKISAAAEPGIDLDKVPTEISPEVGGAFTLFGGIIVGRHVELVLNRRIVQAWRESNWDPGVYSLVRFELKAQGAATEIAFDHTGFPKGAAEHLAKGWKIHYWEPLAKYLS